ncbi:MAG: crosslink repair DNA glycosylase YcaQ family protein [Nitriliruptor sp.]
MEVSARQLNRATLARQLLIRREPTSVVEAVRRVVALQAQAPASPYIALWLHDRRFVATGLSIGDADALVPHLVAFAAEPRTKAEVEQMLTERLGASPGPGLWRALRLIAPLVHAATGGPWTFGSRPSYVAAPRVAASDEHDRCVRQLLWRYLEGFGPATVQDITQFTMLRRPEIAPALAAMADDLVTFEAPGGAVLYDVPDGPLPDADTPRGVASRRGRHRGTCLRAVLGRRVGRSGQRGQRPRPVARRSGPEGVRALRPVVG